MIDQQLLDFIRQQLQNGLNRETISKELLINGWTEQDIQEAFEKTTITTSEVPTTINLTPVNNLPTLKTKQYSFRNIYVLISLLLIVGAIVFTLVELKKPLDKQVDLNTLSNTKTSVDIAKLQEVKAAFPKGFPLPADSEVIAAEIIPSKQYGDFTLPSDYNLIYISQNDTAKILALYTQALKEQGLDVSTRPPEPGKQTITGDYLKNGVADSTNQYEIGISVSNTLSGAKNITIWLNK